MWSNLLEAYKKDLSEFAEAVTDTGSKLAQGVAELTSDSRALGPDDDDEEPERKLDVPDAALNTLRVSEDTYRKEVGEGEKTDFAAFSGELDLSEHTADIEAASTLPEVKRLLAELVPDELSYDLFWTRYLFRLRRLRRAWVLGSTSEREDDDDLGWGDDDDEGEQFDDEDTTGAPTTGDGTAALSDTVTSEGSDVGQGGGSTEGAAVTRDIPDSGIDGGEVSSLRADIAQRDALLLAAKEREAALLAQLDRLVARDPAVDGSARVTQLEAANTELVKKIEHLESAHATLLERVGQLSRENANLLAQRDVLLREKLAADKAGAQSTGTPSRSPTTTASAPGLDGEDSWDELGDVSSHSAVATGADSVASMPAEAAQGAPPPPAAPAVGRVVVEGEEDEWGSWE